MIIGLILLVLGILAVVFKIKLVPADANAHVWFIVIGILLTTGLGLTLWTGLVGLFSAGGGVPVPSGAGAGAGAVAYMYSSTVTVPTTYTADEANHVITIPTESNATATNFDPIRVNFTTVVADSSNDMRGVKISCSAQSFYTQNESKTDSNLYSVVQKGTDGKSDIRIYDTSDNTYTKRERTFLLGGESSKGQTISTQVYVDVSAEGLYEIDTYNSKDVTCNIGGTDWKIRINKASTN